MFPSGSPIGKKGSDLLAAGYAVYGPKTLLVISYEKKAPMMYAYIDGAWQHMHQMPHVQEKKIFAPGNLRAAKEDAVYAQLIQQWQDDGYTLRYSGGMVPDVHHILSKSGGVFSYPHPAKLRLLYEVAPMSYVVEAAGGASLAAGGSALHMPITSLDERTDITLGSKEEVKKVQQAYVK